MSEQRIQSQDISIAELFQSFYVVPAYQREYVWEEAEVDELLTDINTEMGDGPPDAAPEYFIGSIVVCPSKNSLLEIIDGQQRMTTLFVTLCAIRDHIKSLGKKPPGVLDLQLAAPSADVSGQEVERYRLDLQYEDSGDVLKQIAQGNVDVVGPASTRSVTNIVHAYRTARQFLKRAYRDDETVSRRYYGYLTNKVKLIRIQAEDVAKALKIFETINDRGVGLNAMDLLKNLLFMKANREQFETLNTVWKDLQDTLFAISEKPLRFLRYYIFSQYNVDVLREEKIYEWFTKNEILCGYSKSPVPFAKELLVAAQAYRNFFQGKDKHGAKNRQLENIQLLGGKAARQHLIILLAGRNLPASLFDRLCHEVENLFFCYVITREPTRDFEHNFAAWAKEVREAKSDSDLDTIVQKRFKKAKSDLVARFKDAFERMTTDSLQGYRLRYVLAKLTQHVELAAYGETEGSRWLSRFVAGGFEIEHIFPQTPSDKAKAEFGPCSDSLISERLGNLVLVEKSINGSLGNRAYSEKWKVYPQSQLLLTRALAVKPKIGFNTKIDSAVADFEAFTEWNESFVVARQRKLTKLAYSVWELPWSDG